jgi:hypothetical protein
MGAWLQGGTAYSVDGYSFVAGNGFHGPVGYAILVAAKSLLISQGDLSAGVYVPGGWYVVLNAYIGVGVGYGSQYIESSANDPLYIQYNGQAGGVNYDLFMQGLSVANSASIIGSRIFNIPTGVLSVDGCYIY